MKLEQAALREERIYLGIRQDRNRRQGLGAACTSNASELKAVISWKVFESKESVSSCV